VGALRELDPLFIAAIDRERPYSPGRVRREGSRLAEGAGGFIMHRKRE
jgi:hypothetical protein